MSLCVAPDEVVRYVSGDRAALLSDPDQTDVPPDLAHGFFRTSVMAARDRDLKTVRMTRAKGMATPLPRPPRTDFPPELAHGQQSWLEASEMAEGCGSPSETTKQRTLERLGAQMLRSTKTAAWSEAASTGLVISGKWSKRSPFFPPHTPLAKIAGIRHLSKQLRRQQDVVDFL